MLMYRNHWAFAHDVQQDAFMESAAMYVAATPKYSAVPWLLQWREFWLHSVGNQGNGASYIGVDEFLTDDGRVEAFREFLRDYRSWLIDGADEEHVAARLNPVSLIAYAETADAVLTGDESHPNVHRTQDAEAAS
ncbi:hypothetical protein [Dactylosporangium sp. NPDC049140]|uniref:hypothetical protein n=1 Tax=Dactylosporangium sp. NPDC049140 TaxID=3155647 RepID=UPI0033DAA744